MKKRDLTVLAMMGISAALIAGGCQKKDGEDSSNTAALEQLTPEFQAFYNSLSPEGQQKFDQLDGRHRVMAMQMVKQSCNGQNSCAGQGGCKTGSHACAGQNSCKALGGYPVKDPNRAVDIQLTNQGSGK